jgi:hypothetical protein
MPFCGLKRRTKWGLRTHKFQLKVECQSKTLPLPRVPRGARSASVGEGNQQGQLRETKIGGLVPLLAFATICDPEIKKWWNCFDLILQIVKGSNQHIVDFILGDFIPRIIAIPANFVISNGLKIYIAQILRSSSCKLAMVIFQLNLPCFTSTRQREKWKNLLVGRIHVRLQSDASWFDTSPFLSHLPSEIPLPRSPVPL